MEIEEIVATCSLPPVAAAAVQSIGGAFAKRMTLLAAAEGRTTGTFVAGLVRSFADTMDDCDRSGLRKAMAGHPMPVLAGLQMIVEATLEDGPRPWRKRARSAGDCRPC